MILSSIYISIFISLIIFFILLILLTSYICFRMCFYTSRKKTNEEYPIPDGKEYEQYRDDFVDWMKKVRSFEFKDCEIKSFDGLVLKGKYFEFVPNAPIELMLHGYRGDSERDLSGGVLRCKALDRNVLLVDHRASGRSEGKVITFGINESKDVIKWVDYIINNINKDAKIIITGVSMGASTAMIVSSFDLPDNVKGILSDCGFTSAKEIIKKVIKDMKLPSNIFYPFVKLGAKIFGKFNLEEISPNEAVKKSKLPILFIHGKDDQFVPHEMTIKNYNDCCSPKQLYLVDKAGHCLCYMIEPEIYLDTLRLFFDKLTK